MHVRPPRDRLPYGESDCNPNAISRPVHQSLRCFVGFVAYPYVYTSTGLITGLNLSLAMIQQPYGAYKAPSFGGKLLSARLSQEAVSHVVCVEELSGHRAVRSNAPDGERGPRARKVELNDGALVVAHKAVVHVCVVNVPSSSRPILIDIPREGTLVESRTGVRSIENCNRAMLIQQEAVIHKVRVNEDSQNASIRGKAAAIRTLEWACASARNIECGDDAFLVPQKAMGRKRGVKVESCDLPTWADCETLRALTGCCACTRRIERGENPILIAHETVKPSCRVNVVSRDRPVRVD